MARAKNQRTAELEPAHSAEERVQVCLSEEERIYLAAVFYYAGEKSQAAIAEALGLKNASSVSRLLEKARQRGVVRFQFQIPPGRHALAMRLREELRLDYAEVILTPPEMGSDPEVDAMRRTDLLGAAAARFLCEREILTGNLGFGGGRTMTAFAREWASLAPRVRFDLYALGASSLEPLELSAAGVTSLACSLLNAEFRNRPGAERTAAVQVKAHAIRLPAIETSNVLQRQSTHFYDTAEREVQVVLTGIGSLRHDWVVSREDMDCLQQREGAIGEVLGSFFGEQGRAVSFTPRNPVLPFELVRLQRMVAAGKQVIILGAGKPLPLAHLLMAQRRCVTGVVTDERTAERVLELCRAF